MENYRDEYDYQNDAAQIDRLAREYARAGLDRRLPDVPFDGKLPVWLTPHARRYVECCARFVERLDALPRVPWRVNNADVLEELRRIKRENALQVAKFAQFDYPAHRADGVKTAPIKQLLAAALNDQKAALLALCRLRCAETRAQIRPLIVEETLCSTLLHGILI